MVKISGEMPSIKTTVSGGNLKVTVKNIEAESVSADAPTLPDVDEVCATIYQNTLVIVEKVIFPSETHNSIVAKQTLSEVESGEYEIELTMENGVADAKLFDTDGERQAALWYDWERAESSGD